MTMNLDESVSKLKGVGKVRADKFAQMNVYTLNDLLTHYPRRYEDRTKLTPIAKAAAGEVATVSGTVMHVGGVAARTRLTIVKAVLRDSTGKLELLWFNQRHIQRQLQVGMKLVVTGKVGLSGRQLSINNPEFEIIDDGDSVTLGIIPVYSVAQSIPQKWLRGLLKQILKEYVKQSHEDIIPPDILAGYNLMARNQALVNVHYPQSMDMLDAARRRLAFEELYVIQCGLLYIKEQSRRHSQGVRHLQDSRLLRAAQDALPFALTDAQSAAWEQIRRDMESHLPMRRLLQGDVGSGKTAVALLALVKTVENGYQGALMAPTEILAEQHYQTFTGLLTSLEINVAALSGKMTKKHREAILTDLAAGAIDILVGTHALIQADVTFKNLGLVVTDEQHRFGVRQRGALTGKGVMPDALIMTATPIPRTMTLTVYGDLDVSVIDRLPPGRQKIKTFVRTQQRRELIYKFVCREIAAGRQAYVVCPLIEKSDAIEAPAACEVYEQLRGTLPPQVACGLLHGQMSSKDKDAVMARFAAGAINLLVSTTVVEVGVNVPNASVMVVEGAERFGLAQLHQLRGRIGRGEYQSYCILVSGGQGMTERLKLMEQIDDGFRLAEEDLKLRGPGQFFGDSQHGLPDLKMANVFRDAGILLQARDAALLTLAKSDDLERILRQLSKQYRGHFSFIASN